MRCNPLRWLWGLLPLTILVWLTVVVEQPRIEADLAARTYKALEAAGLGWAGLEFYGRDAVLAGETTDEAGPRKAVQIAQNVWGVRRLDSKIAVVAKRDDYAWQAERSSSAIRLGGDIPDENKRAAIIDMVKAKFPDLPIEDHMTLSSGVPEIEKWLAAVAFGLDRLAQLKAGSVALQDLGLSISGEAVSPAAYLNAKSAITKDLPKGVTLVGDAITPPLADPYAWGMQKTAAEFVLNGHVPDEGARAELFNSAKAAFPSLAIIDRMELASGAPGDWVKAATVMLGALSALQEGEVAATAGDVVLRGRVPDEATATRIASQLQAALPANFKLRTDLAFPPPAPPVVSPYTTRIEASPESVVLSGSVPSDAARAELVGQAKRLFPDNAVVDELVLGSGADEGWLACLSAGFEALGRLGNGSIALSDRSIHVSGRTKDETLAEALPAQVRAGANRACEPRVEIVLDVPPEPNLRWRAANAGEGEVVLEGQVPDGATEAFLVQTAEEHFSNARLIYRMTVASGKADKWQKVAGTALQLLAKLRRGEAVLDGQQLTLSGEAGDASVAAAVKDQLAHTLAKGYTGHPVIEIRSEAMIWADREAERTAAEEAAAAQAAAKRQPAPEGEANGPASANPGDASEEDARRKADEEASRRRAEGSAAWSAARGSPPPQGEEREKRLAEASLCEKHMRSAAAAGTIRFRFASAILDPASLSTLDRLAEIARSCPGFRIEIIGHTDSIGPSDANQALSEARAAVVATYLAKAGIEVARLTTIGYGETRPLVPNTSASNRAKNRRIEFSVKVE